MALVASLLSLLSTPSVSLSPSEIAGDVAQLLLDQYGDAAKATSSETASDESTSEDYRNLPEFNGKDIVGYTDFGSSGKHKIWRNENYEPLQHSFAYDTIKCGDKDICEVIDSLSIDRFCRFCP